MRLFLFSKILVVILCVSAPTAQAASVFNHCKEAVHTGDILTCVKKQHEKASANLNTIYEKLLTYQSDDHVEKYRKSQMDWIIYRDEECAWEVSQVGTESLQRIEELSCLTALTEQRSEILEQFLDNIEQNTADKDLEPLPRWMNVAAYENPQVFWRYGDHISADLNCDTQKEEIMLGLKIDTKTIRIEDENPHEIIPLITVIQNPSTGKPRAEIIYPAAEEAVTGKDECATDISLSLIDYVRTDISSESTEAETIADSIDEAGQCEKALLVKRKNCPSQMLFWNGDAYEFTVAP